MLIEYTDKDMDRRDGLQEMYGAFTPDVWKKAQSFEDAIELFEKYERTPDEMREFNQYWSDGGDEIGEEPDDWDDDYYEDSWDDEEEGW